MRPERRESSERPYNRGPVIKPRPPILDHTFDARLCCVHEFKPLSPPRVLESGVLLTNEFCGDCGATCVREDGELVEYDITVKVQE